MTKIIDQRFLEQIEASLIKQIKKAVTGIPRGY
jgi:hypothetical protein